MTRIQSNPTTIGLLTADGSAFVGYFAASSVAPSDLSKAAPFSFASGALPAYDVMRWPSPTSIVARPPLPASPLRLLMYGTPRFTSAALAMSQDDVNLLVPTGLNCTEQSAGS